jgi:phosphoribosylamine--glycine ligase
MMFGVPVAGPTQAASKLEWSKSWARDFMKRHGIPSPDYVVLEGADKIAEHLRAESTTYPLIMKADGLAGGKGVSLIESAEDGVETISKMQERDVLPTDNASVKVVLEEYLRGTEVSAMAFTDGRKISMMPPVCDYKRLLDNDEGPLTGGMGAYTPTGAISPAMWNRIERDIIGKAVRGMLDEGMPYRGVLYAGLMITEQGPKVLEFNCRLGDPEAQVLMPKLKTPIEDIALAMAKGDLGSVGEIEWDNRAAVGVVIASEGYPITQPAATKVGGLANVEEGVLVFHAGTKLQGARPINPMASQTVDQPSVFGGLFGKKDRVTTGNLRTDYLSPKINAVGGRLLTVVGLAATLPEARNVVYRNLDHIKIEATQYRKDIAAREG